MAQRKFQEMNELLSKILEEINSAKVNNATLSTQIEEIGERVKEIKEILLQQNGRLRNAEIEIEGLKTKQKMLQWLVPIIMSVLSAIISWTVSTTVLLSKIR
jgi:uncharacterized coiled-coil DUF342 family protein